MLGIRKGKTGASLIANGYRTAYAVFIFLTIASGILLYNLAISNFLIEYVASYTSRELPLLYKLTAFWAGQKGSLLLWGWLLSLFTVAMLFTYRRREFSILPHATAVLMAITLFFTTLLTLVAPPFELLHHAPANGSGLNPLLQHPLMIIHPPLLFVGYVGISVPFAFALAALLSGRNDESWVKNARRWTLIPWLFLTLGIVIGAQWAYVELGWGGYWAWDPVENASLMPWLTATAFMHGIIIQEKKGMLRFWNLALIMITFELCIFGTFITRSGIIESVHAFGKSSIGTMFGVFLVTGVVFCLGALIKGWPKIRSRQRLESFVSRESAGIFNNIVFLTATFAVFWGTIFPLISEALQGQQVSLGVDYYNQVSLPIAMVLLALTGIGPLLAWRKTSFEMLRKQFLWPMVITLTGAVVLWIFEVHHFYAFIAFTLSIFVTATIVQDFYRAVIGREQHHHEKWYAALGNLFVRNQRRYAGHVVHFGVVLVFVGIAGSAFTKHTEVTLTEGQSFKLGRYDIRFQSVEFLHDKIMHRLMANLQVAIGGEVVETLKPEKRLYFTHEQPMTEVALYSTWREDVYLVLAGYDTHKKTVTFSAYVNPLVYWLWIGGWVMAAGALLALLPFAKTSKPAQPSTGERKQPKRLAKRANHKRPRRRKRKSLATV